MLITIRKAQSTAEYAIILGVVVSAALAMQVYIKRGLQARAKAGTDAFTQPEYTFSENGVNATFSSLSQYEPYYYESNYQTQQASKRDVMVDNGYTANIISNEISGRATGGYTKQHGLRESADNMWEEK